MNLKVFSFFYLSVQSYLLSESYAFLIRKKPAIWTPFTMWLTWSVEPFGQFLHVFYFKSISSYFNTFQNINE